MLKINYFLIFKINLVGSIREADYCMDIILLWLGFDESMNVTVKWNNIKANPTSFTFEQQGYGVLDIRRENIINFGKHGVLCSFISC